MFKLVSLQMCGDDQIPKEENLVLLTMSYINRNALLYCCNIIVCFDEF